MKFTDLIAWQKGVELVKEVYRLTEKFPRSEQYNLTSQLQRSATSVVTNIAEGFGRAGSDDKAYKYIIARGECTEVHSLLLVAISLKRLKEDSAEKVISLALEIGRLLSGLIERFASK